MPDISRVTNPVPGYDNVNRNTPTSPNDTQIQNIPDPSRVGRADARTDRQDAGDSTALRYDSNFQAFLQALREAGTVTETMARMLMTRMGTLVSSGMTEGMATELSQFFAMLKLSPEQMLQLLKNQMSATAKFSGPLFSFLREALSQSPSAGMKNDVLQFLKRFNDFSSTPHIEGNLLRNVRQMIWFMPQRYGESVHEQLTQLEALIGKGDRAGALSLLQGTLVPYMSDYVAQMHDLGIVRSLLSLFTLDITRYESGSPENMLQAFRQLAGYAPFSDQISSMTEQDLMALLNDTAFHQSAQNDAIADQLLSLAGRALRGEGGPELRQTFQELVSSILVNESVYMPLNHFMLPLELDGRMMYSEMWVDPDAENDAERGKSEKERTLRFLLKFDVQELGLFDLVLSYRQGTIDVQIRCPERIGAFSRLIEQQLHALAEKNGVRVQGLHVESMVRPLTISEVFPKIFDRKDSVNVRV